MKKPLTISCFTFYILRFTFYIFCFLFCVLNSSAQQSKTSGEHNRSIDSLLTSLKADRNDTNKVKHLYQLCSEFRQTGKYNEGLKYGNDALELALQLKFKKGMADAYIFIGNIHANKGDYEKALEFYLKSLKIKEEIGDKKGMADSYGNIGTIQWNKGDYDKALEFYLKALKIFEEIGDKKGMAGSYIGIGNIHRSKGDYEKALEFFLKDIKITEELGDKKGMAGSYINIGIIHDNNGDYEKALEFYTKSLKITEELGDKNGMADAYNNIGNFHANKGDYEKALEFYLKSLKITEELGDKKGMTAYYGNIGLLNSDLKKFSEARIFLNKGLQLSIEIGTKDFTRNAYSGLSQLDSTLSNWKAAYHYHQLYALYKDSLFNEETTKQIADMQTKYEADKKEKENSILRKNKEIRILQEKQKAEQQRLLQEKIERRNRLQYSAIVLGLFVLFLGIFLFANRFGKFTEHQHYRKFMKITEVSLFISFLILFEFITVLIDPFIEKFTGGEPMFKLILNAVLATIIFPIHHYLEKKLSGTFIPGGGHKGGVGKYLVAFILVCFINFHPPLFVSSQTRVTQTNRSDTARINTLNALAEKLQSTNPDTALILYNQALEIAQSIATPSVRLKETANAYHNIGIIHHNIGDYENALEFYLKALKITEEFGVEYPDDVVNKKGMADSYNKIGVVHFNKGDYDKALEFYLKSLKIREEIGDKKGMASSYNNIGLIHAEKGDYEKALEIYFKALKINAEIGNKNWLANNYNNIGLIHWGKKDYEKALEFYLKSLSIKEELGDKHGMANSYNNIGIIHKNKAEQLRSPDSAVYRERLYDIALKYYLKALKIREELGDKNGMASSYGNIGLLYSKDAQIRRPFKKFVEARIYLNKCLQLSTEIGTKEWIKNAYGGLSELDSSLGNWKSAYQYHKLYSVYNDSILNEETTKQIADMQTRYETDKKEKENQLLRKEELLIELQKKRAAEEAKIQSEKISKRNLLQYTFIAIVLFILGMSLGIFKRFKVPAKVMEVAVFVVFMLFFEFTLVLTDPVIDYVTGGAPLLKLMFNSVIAAVLFFLHRKSERWVLRE